MIKACIFDLDGTLLNTLNTISYHSNAALEKFGIEPIETEKYRYIVGNGAKIQVERMLKQRGVYTKELYEKVYEFYMEHYNADVSIYTEPYDGIKELLSGLKKRKILTGVISNKPDYAAREAIDTFLCGLIDITHGQIEGVKIKPDPEGTLNLLKELGVNAEECLYIGDTKIDMQTGKNVGAFTVGVLWGFRDYGELKENGADLIVENPGQILAYIDKIVTFS